MKDFGYLQQKYIVPTYPFRGLTLVKGKGAYLYSQAGDKYLDLMTNIGVNIFGHNHPEITQALIDQLKKLNNLHGSFANDIRSLASQKLVERCGGRLTAVYWANSGSEAIEAALKFAIIFSNKTELVAARGGYHGKTLGALSATFGLKYKKPFKEVLMKTRHVKYGELTQLKTAISDKTAAVILEPIQGETGIIVPPNDYLKGVANLCRKKGVLLIVDEIQTGMGRTGRFLASKNIQPDMVCLGKGLAGGIPVGATLVTKEISDKLTKSIHTSTFGGNPLAGAGVLAVLKLLTKEVLATNIKLGSYFLKKLREIKSKQIKQVRGQGLMIGVELKGKNTPVLKEMQQRGIIAVPAGDRIVRFLPSYIISKKNLDLTVKTLKEILTN